MVDLGKVDRPEAESFKAARKLYLVPLVHAGEGSPAEYVELSNKYWEGVRASIESLETRLGPVRRVYHEVLFTSGDDGLKMLESVCRQSYDIVKLRIGLGAVIEEFEDESLFYEFLDWQRCLGIGFISNIVGDKVTSAFLDAMKKRFEHLSKRIDDSLGASEVGLLFISEDHKLQFPSGIEVFYVAPPALDEIHRWLREQRGKKHAENEEGRKQQGDS
ncbi:MAG: hypothetical protein Q7T05_05915 [Dehalococcoidia bacterium]|nr:hypothetical protein [Dehalococcoidia bacterium]